MPRNNNLADFQQDNDQLWDFIIHTYIYILKYIL